jgi:hypothetical protein
MASLSLKSRLTRLPDKCFAGRPRQPETVSHRSDKEWARLQRPLRVEVSNSRKILHCILRPARPPALLLCTPTPRVGPTFRRVRATGGKVGDARRWIPFSDFPFSRIAASLARVQLCCQSNEFIFIASAEIA